jgi:cytochrome c553
MKKNMMIGAILAFAVTVTLTAAAADGKALYEKDCAKCHGADGKGATKMGQKLGCKDYSSAKAWENLKDADALKAVKEGVKDKDGKVVMKPVEGVTDEDAKAVVEYMKTLKK